MPTTEGRKMIVDSGIKEGNEEHIEARWARSKVPPAKEDI